MTTTSWSVQNKRCPRHQELILSVRTIVEGDIVHWRRSCTSTNIRRHFIRVRLTSAYVFRGSSPSQLVSRQSPRRYAINRLGNRSKTDQPRLTPTKARVAFVTASPGFAVFYDRAACLGSEYGVQNQLESPDHRGAAAGGTIASNAICSESVRECWPPKEQLGR
jgi:hypothetical protein